MKTLGPRLWGVWEQPEGRGRRDRNPAALSLDALQAAGVPRRSGREGSRKPRVA
jgi:hypothetical protein